MNENTSLLVSENANGNVAKFKLYKRRWVIVSAISFLAAINGLNWLCYASISRSSSVYFGVSDTWINVMSLIYQIVSIPGFVLAAILTSRIGMKQSMFWGACFNALGAGIRAIGPLFFNTSGGVNAFIIAAIGQFMCAIAQGPILVIAPAFSNTWLATNERDVGTALVSMSNILGLALAYIVSPSVVTLPERVYDLQWILFAVSAVLFVFDVIVFRTDHPSSPPSFGATAEKIEFSKSFKFVFKRTQSLILLSIFAVGLGVNINIMSLIDPIMISYGYIESETSIFGVAYIGVGVISGIVMGILVAYVKAYKVLLMIGGSIGFIALISTTILLNVVGHNFALFAVLFGLIGLGMLGVAPIILEAGAEVSYPAPEIMLTSFLWSSGNAVGGILLIILSIVPIYGALGVLCGTFSLAWIFLVMFKGDTHRLDAETIDSDKGAFGRID